jgi:hypothetical protein
MAQSELLSLMPDAPQALRDVLDAAHGSRETHLLMIQSLGRLDWQDATGYDKRALVRAAMGRGSVRVTGLTSKPKRPSRSPCLTACWLPDARTP